MSKIGTEGSCGVIAERFGEEAANERRRLESNLAIDPLILGEVRFGILWLPPRRLRRDLHHWSDECHQACSLRTMGR